jgi:hypothetical protein
METKPGKIFLSDQRGIIETDQFRRSCFFNSASYFNEHKQPFRSLYLFNEEILGGAAVLKTTVDVPSFVIILPVTGDLMYQTKDFEVPVEVGQLIVSSLQKGSSYTVQNPYGKDEITFLQIIIRTGAVEKPVTNFAAFDLESAPNSLTTLSISRGKLPFKLSIGKFAGREETVYTTSPRSNGLFCFALSGAFETEGRLLHPKDGLALWDTKEVEIEALSNDAVMLALELTP